MPPPPSDGRDRGLVCGGAPGRLRSLRALHVRSSPPTAAPTGIVHAELESWESGVDTTLAGTLSFADDVVGDFTASFAMAAQQQVVATASAAPRTGRRRRRRPHDRAAPCCRLWKRCN